MVLVVFMTLGMSESVKSSPTNLGEIFVTVKSKCHH